MQLACHNCNTRMIGPRLEMEVGEVYDCPRCGAVIVIDRYDLGDIEGAYLASRPVALAGLRAKAAAILYAMFGRQR